MGLRVAALFKLGVFLAEALISGWRLFKGGYLNASEYFNMCCNYFRAGGWSFALKTKLLARLAPLCAVVAQFTRERRYGLRLLLFFRLITVACHSFV